MRCDQMCVYYLLYSKKSLLYLVCHSALHFTLYAFFFLPEIVCQVCQSCSSGGPDSSIPCYLFFHRVNIVTSGFIYCVHIRLCYEVSFREVTHRWRSRTKSQVSSSTHFLSISSWGLPRWACTRYCLHFWNFFWIENI